MNNITLQDLLKKLEEYNPDEIEIVKKAYEYADMLHTGQTRQSGEPYIIHPLNVAYILTEMHADRDTICAGLLHDTLEDTHITKEDIAHYFNQDIANLVDTVKIVKTLYPENIYTSLYPKLISSFFSSNTYPSLVSISSTITFPLGIWSQCT